MFRWMLVIEIWGLEVLRCLIRLSSMAREFRELLSPLERTEKLSKYFFWDRYDLADTFISIMNANNLGGFKQGSGGRGDSFWSRK